jgi:hypothetical protein
MSGRSQATKKEGYMFNKTQPILMLIPLCLLLTGCMNGLSADNGHGGIITQYFMAHDYANITQQAQAYCSQHGLGEPTISQVQTGCPLVCGSEYNEYQFQCGAAVKK